MVSEHISQNRCDNGVPVLILARGGSKGIPKKNLALLGGRPLLVWAIQAARSCNGVSQVWVSTEATDIAQVAKENGANVHERSLESATDEAPSIKAVGEFLLEHPHVSVFILLQCTSPFVQPSFLQTACGRLASGAVDSVFSVTRRKEFIWITDDSSSDRVPKPLNFDPSQRPRRQDWAGVMVENGMFYGATRELVLERGVLQGGRAELVEVPPEMSADIDSPMDLALAETSLTFLRSFHEINEPGHFEAKSEETHPSTEGST